MIDLRIVERHGFSAKSLREKFENRDRLGRFPKAAQGVPLGKVYQTKDDKIDAWLNRAWSRITAGRDWNFANFSTLYAMDLIWDAPFRQVSPTLIMSVCEKYGQNTPAVFEALKGLGLDFESMVVDTGTTDKSGQPVKALNAPAFFAVMVPIVRAYLTIRRARIVNDRNREPFIEYRPAVQSNENRVRCEVLTSRVQETARAYDYKGTLNQAVFQMFLYPTGCLVFTKEEWDQVKQVRAAAGPDNELKEEDYIVREGLRYHCPHPSRVFWDMAHPQRTFNTDTGCEYAGYWHVCRYGDILKNEAFYNRDNVSIGDTGWFGSTPAFWRTVYNACVVKVPSLIPPTGQNGEAAVDREQYLADNPYYTQDMTDASVMLCEYREKVVPADWGLGDYKYPIWMRALFAGDGTVLYAAPVGYTPVHSFKDNGDDKRVSDASLALQLTPFQDQLSNLLTQFLLAAKQNLANLTLVEKNIVKGDGMKQLRNNGETFFRSLNILEYDSKDLRVLQVDPSSAVVTSRFAPLDTNGIVLAMKLVLDMAERVLQFSSQEIAQAATHEQTKAEVERIHATTTNLLEYTANPVDEGINAMARQNYEALMNYGEDEFYAQIPSDHDLQPERLKELGITQDETPGITRDKKIRVKVTKKTAMVLDSFAVVPPNNKRETNWEAAQALAGFVRDLMNNQVTAMAIGPKQAIDLANHIAKMAGLRLEQPLRDATAETQQQQASDLLKQTVEAVLGMVRPEVKQGMEVVMSETMDLRKQLEAIIQALGINVPPSNNAAVAGGTGGPAGVAPATERVVVPPAVTDAEPLGAT